MKTIEKISGIIIVISIILKLINIPATSVFLILSSSTLMILYFNFGIALFNNIPIKGILKKKTYQSISFSKITIAVVSGLSLSIIITGILFRLQHWPGATFQLTIGLTFSGLVLILAVAMYLKEHTTFYKELLTRLLIIGSFGLILFFTTDYTIDKIRYRNYPEYIKALNDLEQHPNNTSFRNKVDYEYNKIFFSKEELKAMNIHDK